MRRWRQKLLALIASAAVVLGAGCGFPSFDPPSLVDSVRILAVKAEPPEAPPGSSVELEAAIYDPAGAPVQIWFFCEPDPVAGPTACAEFLAGGGIVLPDDMGPMTTFDVAADALDGVEEGSAIATAAHIVCGGGDLPECFGEMTKGEELMLSEQLEISIKRITISESTTPNQNPIIESIEIDFGSETNVPLTATEIDCGGGAMANACIVSGDVVTFHVNAAAGSNEDYFETVEGEPEERTEELITSFFATSGRFRRIRGVGEEETPLAMDDEWASTPEEEDAPVAEPGSVVRFWFVVRDGRGGTDFLERSIGLIK